MPLTIDLFASAKDLVGGASQITVHVDLPCTVADLRAAIAREHTQLAELCTNPSTTIAIDSDFADDTDVIDGSSSSNNNRGGGGGGIAILPPVSGG